VLNQATRGLQVLDRSAAPERRLTVVGKVSASARDQSSQSWGRGLILLAGGDEAWREWTRKTLEIEGYTVLVATDAIRFMELMIRYRSIVRLIVSGAVLEGSTPQHLVQLVRDNLNGDVPVVVSSGGIDGTDLPSRTAGTPLPDAFLTLQFNAAQLVATIDELALPRSQTGSGEQALQSRSASA
jgi:CheY-like chemotaxis protein